MGNARTASSASIPNSESITLADGRALCFARHGRADGKPVIYLHGAGSSRIEGELYDQQARAAGVQIIATDRPGCGGSSPAPGRSFASYALDLQELADTLGIGRFVVAGMSNGGVYAMAAAARLPDRVTATILINTSTPLHDAVARQATPASVRLTYALVRHAVPLTLWSLKRFANSAKADDQARRSAREVLRQPDSGYLQGGAPSGLGFRFGNSTIPVSCSALWRSSPRPDPIPLRPDHGETAAGRPPALGGAFPRGAPGTRADRGGHGLRAVKAVVSASVGAEAERRPAFPVAGWSATLLAGRRRGAHRGPLQTNPPELTRRPGFRCASSGQPHQGRTDAR